MFNSNPTTLFYMYLYSNIKKIQNVYILKNYQFNKLRFL